MTHPERYRQSWPITATMPTDVLFTQAIGDLRTALHARGRRLGGALIIRVSDDGSTVDAECELAP